MKAAGWYALLVISGSLALYILAGFAVNPVT